jgi:hypothetical protein
VSHPEAGAESREVEGVLQACHGFGRCAEEAEPPGDGRHEVGGALESAAENDSEGRSIREARQGVEIRQNTRPAEAPVAETAGGRAVMLGQRQGVGIAEQVEDQRAQARPARRLREGAAGLRRDEEGVGARRQPATSTASV